MSYFPESLHEHAKFLGYANLEAFIIKRWDVFDEGTKVLLKMTNNSPDKLIQKIGGNSSG